MKNPHPSVSVPCSSALPTVPSSDCVDGSTVHLTAKTHRGSGSTRNQTRGNVRAFPGPLFSPSVQGTVTATALSRSISSIFLGSCSQQPSPLHSHPQPSTGTGVSPQSVSGRFFQYNHRQMFPNVASQIQNSMENPLPKQFIQFILNIRESQ